MKKSLFPFLAAALAALILELPGWWWAMPLAGFIAGFMVAKGVRGFLLGGLGVMAAWAIYIFFFASTSPLGELLTVFSGILGLPSSLAFVPVLLALVAAFLLGGVGGLTGAMLPALLVQNKSKTEKK